MSSFAPKKYGLQLRGTKPDEGPKKPVLGANAVFGDDDSEEEAPQKGAKGKPMGIAGIGVSKQKKQVELQLKKAMAEDPSVFEYDEVYDNMAEAKNQVEEAKREANRVAKAQPKYISAILKATEVRKVEHERRLEKKIKKEREAEGDQFADKEAFVTSAYKQKMLEMQKAEEEERRLAAREAAEDVTKQSDMMGFYRNLLTKNVAMGGTEQDEKKKKQEQEKQEKQNAEAAEKEAKRPLPTAEDNSSKDDGAIREKEKEREEERRSDDRGEKVRIPNGEEERKEKEGRRERREKSHESSGARGISKEKGPTEGRSGDEGRGKREPERKVEGKSDEEGRGKREAERLEEEKRKYARRNDEDAVAAARAKAMARRAAKKTPGALVQGDD